MGHGGQSWVWGWRVDWSSADLRGGGPQRHTDEWKVGNNVTHMGEWRYHVSRCVAVHVGKGGGGGGAVG